MGIPSGGGSLFSAKALTHARRKRRHRLDISVIGAGGAIGREIVGQLVAGRVLRPTERLQLVGKAGGASERALYGLRSDLTDAYAENAPLMDIALGPDDVVGDIIVMAAGVTPGPSAGGGTMTRDDVASANLPIFAAHASALAERGQGHEVVLVVTNPVELGVAVLARALGGAAGNRDRGVLRQPAVPARDRRRPRRPAPACFRLCRRGARRKPRAAVVERAGIRPRRPRDRRCCGRGARAGHAGGVPGAGGRRPQVHRAPGVRRHAAGV